MARVHVQGTRAKWRTSPRPTSSRRSSSIIQATTWPRVTREGVWCCSSGTRSVLERSQLCSVEKHADVVLYVTQSGKKGCEYKFYTEFQSHEPEFDYLKSLEIEEKINKIRWCRRQNQAHFLLSTNGASFFFSHGCCSRRGC